MDNLSIRKCDRTRTPNNPNGRQKNSGPNVCKKCTTDSGSFRLYSGRNARRIYEIEKEINNDEILKELTTVFEKYGYNTDEISSELLDGEKIKLDMNDDNITKLAESVNTTEHFTAYLDDSTDYMIVESIQ